MWYLMHNANVVTNISYFQHKYVEVKSLRRSWRVSNILLYKTLGWKLSGKFSLYLNVTEISTWNAISCKVSIGFGKNVTVNTAFKLPLYDNVKV